MASASDTQPENGGQLARYLGWLRQPQFLWLHVLVCALLIAAGIAVYRNPWGIAGGVSSYLGLIGWLHWMAISWRVLRGANVERSLLPSAIFISLTMSQALVIGPLAPSPQAPEFPRELWVVGALSPFFFTPCLLLGFRMARAIGAQRGNGVSIPRH